MALRWMELRLRCHDGWVSETSGTGEVLCEPRHGGSPTALDASVAAIKTGVASTEQSTACSGDGRAQTDTPDEVAEALRLHQQRVLASVGSSEHGSPQQLLASVGSSEHGSPMIDRLAGAVQAEELAMQQERVRARAPTYNVM